MAARKPLVVVAVPLLLTATATATGAVGCASSGGDAPVVETGESILGGKVDHGHAAVGVVVDNFLHGFCTGTLIAPDIVLTAGHCVRPMVKKTFYLGSGRATKG